MKIDFSYSTDTARQGLPWQLKIDGIEHKASQVIFENVSGHSLFFKNESGHTYGWLSVEGDVEWKEKIATVKGGV